MEAILASGFEQGLLYCFMVLGVFITFRVLDFPDLTVDGSLPLGAAVTAALIVAGQSPWLATLAGVGAGLCAGFVTGCLHLLLKSGESDCHQLRPQAARRHPHDDRSLHGQPARHGHAATCRLLGVDGVFEKLGDLFSPTFIGWNLVAAVAVLALRRQVRARLVPAHRVRSLPAGHGRQRADDPRHGHQHRSSRASSASASPTRWSRSPVRSWRSSRASPTSAWASAPSSPAWPGSSWARSSSACAASAGCCSASSAARSSTGC